MPKLQHPFNRRFRLVNFFSPAQNSNLIRIERLKETGLYSKVYESEDRALEDRGPGQVGCARRVARHHNYVRLAGDLQPCGSLRDQRCPRFGLSLLLYCFHGQTLSNI